MAKAKKKKTGLSEKVNKNRRNDKIDKISPFEIKTNRHKHNVLGRKLAKHDKGRPGVSRSKALKKRKDTLLKEYRESSKSNKFIDRRIGEDDADMTVEDKMMQRFALEKQRSHASSSLYSLESEDLTHYGQSLSEIEKFDDPINSDDDDDGKRSKFDKEIGEELFGGFLEKKKSEETVPEVKKSWKERMQDMIANSKKEKYEKQSETEKLRDMTVEVDKQWKELSLVMASCRRGRDTIDENEPGVDDYDIAVNTMKFDVVATATDRLKTEEEIAKEELDKLKGLEVDRMKRMSGVLDTDARPRAPDMRSADDLDVGYKVEGQGSQTAVRFAEVTSSGEESEGEEEEDDDDEEDEGEEDTVENKDAEDEKEESENEDDDDDDDEEESEDSGEDIESESEKEDEETMEEVTKKGPETKSSPKSILKKSTNTAPTKKIDFKVRKDMMESARSEIPFTFEAPETYADLISLLEGYTPQLKLEIITRLRKCHHISLDSDNRRKLEVLFVLLVQYTCDMASLDQPEYATIDGLTPHLYRLCRESPVPCATAMVGLLSQRHQEFTDLAARKAGRGMYPTFDVLVMLRLIAVLFPTSDYTHPVVTPALLFMMQILAQSPVTSLKDVASGLFLCRLCLNYVSIYPRGLYPKCSTILADASFWNYTSLHTNMDKI